METIIVINALVTVVLAIIIFCQHRSTWEVEPEDIDRNFDDTKLSKDLDKTFKLVEKDMRVAFDVIDFLCEENKVEYFVGPDDTTEVKKKKRAYKKRKTTKKKK